MFIQLYRAPCMITGMKIEVVIYLARYLYVPRIRAIMTNTMTRNFQRTIFLFDSTFPFLRFNFRLNFERIVLFRI